MTASGLTNDMLLRMACWEGMLYYLAEGETRETILKKCGNNLIKAIQFLRERSYEGMEIVERKQKPLVKKKQEPKEEPNILDPIYDPVPMPEKNAPIPFSTEMS